MTQEEFDIASRQAALQEQQDRRIRETCHTLKTALEFDQNPLHYSEGQSWKRPQHDEPGRFSETQRQRLLNRYHELLLTIGQ